ncbi:hypothetical protein S1OALGB6SA_70, partial [Olavius algarvensis spirochete endosymbiont]|uniref:hypothetical protein n=1 Tax=Olavius algarvensis spirochete endosymbiont TaxID=260710 RepID=UPI000F0EBC25
STNFYYYEGTKLVRVETDDNDITIYLSYADNETNIVWKYGDSEYTRQTTRRYDEAGRLVYEKSVSPDPGAEIEESIITYEYDDEGRFSKITTKIATKYYKSFGYSGFDYQPYYDKHYEKLFEY